MLNQTNATPLGASVQLIQDVGFVDVVLPFLLIFAITYGSLVKTKIFGNLESVNILVSFVIALSVTITALVVGIIKLFLPIFGLILVFIVSVLIILSLFFGDVKKVTSNKFIRTMATIVLIIILVIVILFIISTILQEAGYLPEPNENDLTNLLSNIFNFIVTIIFLLIIVGVVYFMSKGGSKE